jgi:hypothetical protein
MQRDSQFASSGDHTACAVRSARMAAAAAEVRLSARIDEQQSCEQGMQVSVRHLKCKCATLCTVSLRIRAGSFQKYIIKVRKHQFDIKLLLRCFDSILLLAPTRRREKLPKIFRNEHMRWDAPRNSAYDTRTLWMNSKVLTSKLSDTILDGFCELLVTIGAAGIAYYAVHAAENIVRIFI